MPELYEHQRSGVDWLKDRSRALLADEPGLGKSAQLLLSGEEPFLVVAPAMVLDSGTWDDEIEKWAPGADVTQVAYSSLFPWPSKGGLPRDSHRKPIVSPRPEYRRRWGTLIGDEAHYLANRKSAWTVAFEKLRADRAPLATGTPLLNWAHEAYMLLKLIHGGRRYSSYWRWAREWFDVGPTHWAPMAVGDLLPERSWEEFRAENWGDRMLMRLRDDCLDLPPLTVQPWKVRMKKAQATAYRQLERDFITWLEDGSEVVAWNTAAQVIKLAKAATGLEVLNSRVKGSAKLEALRSILDDRPRPTLVVAHFRDTVARCAIVAQQAGRSVAVVTGDTARGARRQIIRSFQRGNLDVLCATIDVISEGMTLTSADQVVRVERSWRPSRNEQVVRRLHRIGQERPVLAIDLITEGTIDQRVIRLLNQKTDQQMKALGRRALMELAGG